MKKQVWGRDKDVKRGDPIYPTLKQKKFYKKKKKRKKNKRIELNKKTNKAKRNKTNPESNFTRNSRNVDDFHSKLIPKSQKLPINNNKPENGKNPTKKMMKTTSKQAWKSHQWKLIWESESGAEEMGFNFSTFILKQDEEVYNCTRMIECWL